MKYLNLKIYTDFKIFFLSKLSVKNRNFYNFLRINKNLSKSQIYQDLFVIFFTKFKKKGTFIEIGVGNGVDLSNSFLLEKKFKWDGILCEPDQRLQRKIKTSRKSCLEILPIDHRCNKNVIFYENYDPYTSSIKKLNNFASKRKVKSKCLNHLIEKKKTIKNIDYISIDTEGNEYEIIKDFNFKKFKVNIFTIEHNFNTTIRNKIKNILLKNGYIRIFKNISYMDDWYILKNSQLD